jgi:hypothetical protein
LNIPVPHVGHLPFIAGFPFFNVTFTAAGSSLFARHFTQYIVVIVVIHLPSILSLLFVSGKGKQYHYRNIVDKNNSNPINIDTTISVLIISFFMARDSVSGNTNVVVVVVIFGVRTGNVNVERRGD